MNHYLNYHIAQDRHNEFLRQAQKNRQLDRPMRNGTRQVVHGLRVMLPSFRNSVLHIGWLGSLAEQVGLGPANL